jgi:hypothetical protein
MEVKHTRWALCRKLREVWTVNSLDIEEQDRFIEHYDSLTTEALSAIKGELELQDAIKQVNYHILTLNSHIFTLNPHNFTLNYIC